MTRTLRTLQDLLDAVLASPRAGRRRIIALAGAPASGKSTLAEALTTRACDAGCNTQVVPMDGFHLPNQELVDRGLLQRKGAPETFDKQGLLELASKLPDAPETFFPTFDRNRDITIPDAGNVGQECDTVIVEGNYLLYDAPVWRDLRAHWDLAIHLDIPEGILRQRLIARWLTHGLSLEKAELRAAENDLINALVITETSLPADVTFCPERPFQ